jgi:hypothetical protein|tara:strand:+ start:717 stop:1592 length:876 start_codon:yes stop_codon:yes gene_type:complete
MAYGTLNAGAITPGSGATLTVSEAVTFTGAVSHSDANITNVGDISLDTISSDAGTSIGVTLGTDAGDDFNVGGGKLVVEGDNGNVTIGNYLYLDGTSNYLWSENSGSFRIGVDSNAIIAMSNNVFRPSTNNVCKLGHPSYKWTEVYATSTSISSDREIKDNIVNSEIGLSFLNQIACREYKMKDYIIPEVLYAEGDNIPDNKSVGDVKTDAIEQVYTRTHYGLIAQELEEVILANGMTSIDFAPFVKSPKINDSNEEIGGFDYSIRYHEFTSILIKAVQELSAKITVLENA